MMDMQKDGCMARSCPLLDTCGMTGRRCSQAFPGQPFILPPSSRSLQLFWQLLFSLMLFHYNDRKFSLAKCEAKCNKAFINVLAVHFKYGVC